MAKKKKIADDLPEEAELLRYWWKLAQEEDGIARIQALKEYAKLRERLGSSKPRKINIEFAPIEGFLVNSEGQGVAVESTADDKIKKIAAG